MPIPCFNDKAFFAPFLALLHVVTQNEYISEASTQIKEPYQPVSSSPM